METLIPREKIDERVRELAERIAGDYRDQDLVIVGVLKGSVVFMSDLIRQLPLEHEIDFITVSSYGSGTQSTGSVRLLKDLDTDINGRHVLLVEDIVDTGWSLAYIKDNLELRDPASLRICSLLDKRDRREREVDVDYVGFEIPNVFVVGYGMDFDEQYREFPFVGVLSADEATS